MFGAFSAALNIGCALLGRMVTVVDGQTADIAEVIGTLGIKTEIYFDWDKESREQELQIARINAVEVG